MGFSMTADEVQNYGKRYGRTWTTEDLKMKIRKVEVLNFAKRKKAGLKDDVYDLDVWGPTGDHEMKAFLTGYYGRSSQVGYGEIRGERWQIVYMLG